MNAKDATNIFRTQKERNFSVIDNTPINDRGLSPEALGALVYLLSKPDDWDVRDSELRKRFNCGRKKMDRIVGELKQAGYMKREQTRNDQGHFETITYVYEIPKRTDVPLRDTRNGTPVTEHPLSDSGKGDTIVKTDLLKTKDQKLNSKSTQLSQSGQLLSSLKENGLLLEGKEEYEQGFQSWAQKHGVTVDDIAGYYRWRRESSHYGSVEYPGQIMKMWTAFTDQCQAMGVRPQDYPAHENEEPRVTIPAPAPAPSVNEAGIAKVQAMLSGVLNGGNGKNAAREVEYQRLEAKIKRGEELTQEECSAYMAML